MTGVCTRDGQTFHKIYTYIKVRLCVNVVRDFNQRPNTTAIRDPIRFPARTGRLMRLIEFKRLINDFFI